MRIETATSRGEIGGSRAKAAWIREQHADAMDKVRRIEKAEAWLKANPDFRKDHGRADYKKRAECRQLTLDAASVARNIEALGVMAAEVRKEIR